MNTKMLVGGLLGFLVLFLLGWLIYGIILADGMDGGNCMRAHDAVLLLWIALGNLFSGLFLAYILSKMASVTSFASGAMTGGIVGVLLALGFDCLMYGTSTMMANPNFIPMDAVINAVMYAAAGGVVGWWLGRGGGARGVASA